MGCCIVIFIAPDVTPEEGRHTNILERLLYWNNAANFIPIALMHDLIDDNATNTVNEAPGIMDNVRGFDNGQIFHSLETESINGFRQILENNHLNSTSNSINDYDDLFDSY